MASSLKGYIPALARHLGISPAALYERQRALVRAGLLDMSEGRGPGSGVLADSHAIGLLLTAVLATGSLTDTEARVRAIAGAQPVGDQARNFLGSITLATTFLEILEESMSYKQQASLVNEITVSRTAAAAEIIFRDNDGELIVISFAGPDANEPELRVAATLAREPFQEIAADAQAIFTENREESRQAAERKRELAERERERTP